MIIRQPNFCRFKLLPIYLPMYCESTKISQYLITIKPKPMLHNNQNNLRFAANLYGIEISAIFVVLKF